MKMLIIGGVAAGASATARAARLDSSAEIIVFERGEYMSFANCGLPYYVGEVIKQRDSLLVITPEKFKGRTGIEVRTIQEVVEIDPEAKNVKVKNLQNGEVYTESYDKLLMTTGSSPLIPPIPGADDPDVMSLWTIPDVDRIKEKVDSGIKNAIVVGGGFIGVEVAENLAERGVKVTMIEKLPQIMANFDLEMASILEDELTANGIELQLNNGLKEIHRSSGKLVASLDSGSQIPAELIVMSVGIKPNSELAVAAGLETGERKGIKVNEHLQTSNPDIYAAGDVIEVLDPVLGIPTMVPLAGPANRQGRIAADNIFGAEETYKGTLGTSICKVFDLDAASVGASEKKLKTADRNYLKTYIIPNSHASYYPGSELLYMKVLFEENGKILGAQIVGRDGVDKRIDLLATAIKTGLTVSDLTELELAYAPPYGSAKDPVNYAGFVAENIIKGDSAVIFPDQIKASDYLLDIREEDEFICGAIPGSVNIPQGKIRGELQQLPKAKRIVVICRTGLRAYLVERYLRQQGFAAVNLSGGYMIWKLFNREKTDRIQTIPCCNGKPCTTTNTPQGNNTMDNNQPTLELDACGLQCPGPIVQVKHKIDAMKDGDILQVTASDAGFYNDLPAWCESTGNKVLSIEKADGLVKARVQKGANPAPAAGPLSATLKRTTIVLFSSDLDKALAAFIIASGFASLGHDVSIFCTFWGLNVLRKDHPPKVKKNLVSRMFAMMMPRGARKLALSKMHMLGMGTAMMKQVMKSKNIDDLPALISQARLMGVKLIACEMAMNMMGIQQSELLDNVELAGVGNFAALAEKSGPVLFI
jgi:NADPH-dependent 2,4-dienoyl-CoA reductase/sulfur reductase-like enzyme/peroxiredoxin family protein/TusA-related sulfurtransferase/rhodanese-related sulfurtransferase